MGILQCLRSCWRNLALLLTPVLLCPLITPYSTATPEARCAYVMLLAFILWVTEALPLPVTALLPISLCPLLEVAKAKELCKKFFGDASFLLIGGTFVAIAAEDTQLHKRCALKILTLTGVSHRRLLLVLMLTTSLLSMWMNSAATTVLMLPLTRTLLATLFSSSSSSSSSSRPGAASCGRDETRVPLGNSEELLQTEDTACMKNSTREFSETADQMDAIELLGVTEDSANGGSSVIPCDAGAGIPEGDRWRERHTGEQGEPELNFGTSQDSCRDGQHVKEEEEMEQHDPALQVDTPLSPLGPHDSGDALALFSLAICYSANIGGLCTLTGSLPNVMAADRIAEMSGEPLVTFANWFLFALPMWFLCLAGGYLWMIICCFKLRKNLTCRGRATQDFAQRVSASILNEYENMGRLRMKEVVVLVHVFLLAVLWVTRRPCDSPGWASLFEDTYITDGLVAMAVAVSLFIIPNQRPNVLFFRKSGDTSPSCSTPSILSWKRAGVKFPWGALFLLGAGFALDEATKASGLVSAILSKLSFLETLPAWVAVMVITLVMAVVCELTSSSAITTLALPAISELAVRMQINPLFLMLPTTIGTSLNFILPIATPSNAIGYGYGDVKVLSMIKGGIFLKLIGIAVVTLSVSTWGTAIFFLDVFPHWAEFTDLQLPNVTLANSSSSASTLIHTSTSWNSTAS